MPQRSAPPDRSSTTGRPRRWWATRSLSRSLSSTRIFFRKQLWIWPILAVIVLSMIGFAVRASIEATMKAGLQSELETLLGVEVAMLEDWIANQVKNAQRIATERLFRQPALQMLQAQTTESVGGMSDSNRELLQHLSGETAGSGFAGFVLVDRNQRVVSSSHELVLKRRELPLLAEQFAKALDNHPSISTPQPSVLPLKDSQGEVRSGVPVMFVTVPVHDADFRVAGALSLQIRPEREFTRILQLGRLGESGETYAFDRDGLMISNSRFDAELILLGLLADRPHARSIVELLVRDPGGDMTQGFRPTQRRAEMPMTRMAAAATAGKSGSDVEGYRDYRGVRVVGAWRWLEEQEMGVATEIDHAEAFRPLTILQRSFWALYTLLVISSIAIFVFTVIVARLQREAQKAAIEAKRLGQYELHEKLGEGGMGVVYRGTHSMLQRPTAIKLLQGEKVNEAALERFEREVQITCQLNNPSTIAIYDYGRTPEGVFYYAMEFLDGIDLQDLVQQDGPQPEGRVVHILQQVCASLYEAHLKGLVHRDVKPANIMLNHRGGQADVVKVLDFGLVQPLSERSKAGPGITGTPLYLSPEAAQSAELVDACSDLYAVGAVGYFLVTGTPVFDADSLRDLLQKHAAEPAESPSKRLGQPISSELEYALLACLEKSRDKRPQTARDLVKLLQRCPSANSWTSEHAEAWWLSHQRKQNQRDGIPTGSQVTETDHHDVTVDFESS